MNPRVLAVAVVVVALLAQPARATDLDAFAPTTCVDLGQQLAKGSEILSTFNATSRNAVEALRAGRSADGCPALRQVLHFVERAITKLAACADADPTNPHLLAGFQDLHRQIDRIGRREGCLGVPSGS